MTKKELYASFGNVKTDEVRVNASGYRSYTLKIDIHEEGYFKFMADFKKFLEQDAERFQMEQQALLNEAQSK